MRNLSKPWKLPGLLRTGKSALRKNQMRTNKMPAQGEFNLNFEVRPRPARAEGLTVWHRELDQTAREVADKLGLPVGRLVEVRLKDGVIVKGNLRAGEVVQSLKAFDRNKVALEIGGLVFFYAEMESCVRLD